MRVENPYDPPQVDVPEALEQTRWTKQSSSHPLGLWIVGIASNALALVIGAKLWSIPQGEFRLDGSNRLTIVVALGILAAAIQIGLIGWLGRKNRPLACAFILLPVLLIVVEVQHHGTGGWIYVPKGAVGLVTSIFL